MDCFKCFFAERLNFGYCPPMKFREALGAQSSVGRRYLIVLGSIPNGAGPMVEWFCSFLAAPLAAGFKVLS